MKKYLVELVPTIGQQRGDLLECNPDEMGWDTSLLKEGCSVATPGGLGTIIADISDLGRA